MRVCAVAAAATAAHNNIFQLFIEKKGRVPHLKAQLTNGVLYMNFAGVIYATSDDAPHSKAYVHTHDHIFRDECDGICLSFKNVLLFKSIIWACAIVPHTYSLFEKKKKIIPFIAILKTLNTQTGATSIDFPHTHDDDPYHIIAGGMRCWFCEELTTTVAILRQGVQCCFFCALCVQFPDVCIVALLLLMHRPWFCVYVCAKCFVINI